MALLYAQVQLVYEGILIRGGMTIGQVFVDNVRIFGPAFVEAYELESQFARYPRIVLSPKILKALETDLLLRNEDHPLEVEKEFIYNLLRQGDDGIWFIDYLFAFEEEVEFDDYHKLLTQHQDMITKASNFTEEVTGLALKYNWLTKYHNSTLTRLLKKWGQTIATFLRSDRYT